ncbi:putative aminotransferase [Catenaria anguillulae PL171]|uniref:kynurenine--oxoglutarate transaminase n=1 Tax=Catenaria anguillulae PL171 TaxID=765915 RepID=A0A1Y2HIS1_9FUNG|nr:putative aminotransferase [Catenaria anguillulae PL171]
MSSLPRAASRVAHFVQDVWSVFSPLAARTGAVNLGQGFPNFPPPDFVKHAAAASIAPDMNNQYAHPKGAPALRQQLAATFSPLFGRALDVETNMLVTAGANGAIYAALNAYVNEGDEVAILEPFFDIYEPAITLNGGTPVYVPLRLVHDAAAGADKLVDHASDWKLDIGELRSKLTLGKTKVIIINTPQNPTGKVFTRDELHEIGKVAKEFNLLVIADEVYERLVYDGKQHVRIATLSEDLWHRTITVGSAGKTFAVTGWRLGWAIGAPEIVKNVLNAHTRIVFCANAPLQLAIASSLSQAADRDYYATQTGEYAARRDKLLACFRSLGLRATIPEGSYFILVDTSRIAIPDDEWAEVSAVDMPSTNRDWRVCYWLTTKIGVAAIPPSSFYSRENAHLAENLARFCFCKTDETLDEAVAKLEALRAYIR